jgi:hypothetical protein
MCFVYLILFVVFGFRIRDVRVLKVGCRSERQSRSCRRSFPFRQRLGGGGQGPRVTSEPTDGLVRQAFQQPGEGTRRVAVIEVEAEGGGFRQAVAALQAVAEQVVARVRWPSQRGEGQVAMGGIGEAGGDDPAIGGEDDPGAAGIEQAGRFRPGGVAAVGKIGGPQGGSAEQGAEGVEVIPMRRDEHLGLREFAKGLTPHGGIGAENRPGPSGRKAHGL